MKLGTVYKMYKIVPRCITTDTHFSHRVYCVCLFNGKYAVKSDEYHIHILYYICNIFRFVVANFCNVFENYFKITNLTRAW